MKTNLRNIRSAVLLAAVTVAIAWTTPCGLATEEEEMADGEMMSQMMELAKLNENHQLLGQLAGEWNYTMKMWMKPGEAPSESKGTAVRKPIMDGRYYLVEVKGQVIMPGPDGKPGPIDFQGMALEGYDNVQKKFVGSWVDSFSTGMMFSSGTYDPETKSFTYHAEFEMMPGMKTKVREVVKIVDGDHHVLEWFEQHGGQEVKVMEITYTRKK
jgi:hypothetical protein